VFHFIESTGRIALRNFPLYLAMRFAFVTSLIITAVRIEPVNYPQRSQQLNFGHCMQ
jgi:hypothetical protein